MRIEIDHDRCDSTGLCAAVAPEVFTIDDDDMLRVRVSTVPVALWPSVEEAARGCPKLAITLHEQG